ncbi:ImmA/IrrE family metallo-endopeptidase [Undibacterium sp. TJN19]|uniref:ImmA/IrrE family metallo-endopeptidase n=1 Tax=Undibacterium sp. TJN19 TaxID=3413055 RepID=UPI003BF3B7FE
MAKINTTFVGDELESRICSFFEAEISADRFWARRECCKVFRKKGYFSKDRGTNIIFDLSIEVFLPGEDKFSLLFLVECKNYTHSVPVDDAEEFFAKVQQVAAANAKAVIASNASFQSGTRAFAKSKGMGLLRHFDSSNFKWELHRSPSTNASLYSHKQIDIEDGLSRQDFQSGTFDFYLQSASNITNCVWEFFDNLASDTALNVNYLKRALNTPNKLANEVPFVAQDELESLSYKVLQGIGYRLGEVSLEDICRQESELNGLTVHNTQAMCVKEDGRHILGTIRFSPLEIYIYSESVPNRGRERFTLAHELAHHFLQHSRFLSGEICEDADFSLTREKLSIGIPEIIRMEFQANYFAACLLMPKNIFVNDFLGLIDSLNIKNKGFGSLYVDNQLCNIQNYDRILIELMLQYGVSRQAAAIRLNSLGLLNDVREPIY